MLRFDKLCYPDVNIYKQRIQAGLPPIPRKPNIWSTTPKSRALAKSASAMLATRTPRFQTTFNQSFTRVGYRKDLERTVDQKKDKEYPTYTNKISTPNEKEYGIWKKQINHSTGAYNHSESVGFFKNRVTDSAPKWMQLKKLQTPAFFTHKKKRDNEKRKEMEYRRKTAENEDRTTAGSFETPAWFKTDRNGVKPIKNSKTVCHGFRTLLVSHHDRGSTGRGTGVMTIRPDLSLLENRTARDKALIQGPHNRMKTEMVVFVDAAVRQGIKPFDR
jgi:hypothetical protein